MTDHRQWHLWYDILENKKFDVKNLPNISKASTIVINLTPSNAWCEGVSLRPCLLIFNERPITQVYHSQLLSVINVTNPIEDTFSLTFSYRIFLQFKKNCIQIKQTFLDL